MKITFNTEELRTALKKAVSVVDQKSIIPAAECFLFDVRESYVVVTGTNTQNFIQVKCDCVSDEVGKISMQAHRLFDSVSKFKSSDITFTAKDSRLKVKSGRTLVTLPLMNPEEYLYIPSDECKFHSFESSDLLTGISLTKHTIDSDDLRPTMNTIHINNSDGRLLFETITKASVCSMYKVESFIEDFDEMIPKNSVRPLLMILEDSDMVSVGFTERHIIVKDSEHKLFITKVNGKYASLENYIPKDHTHEYIVDKKAMQEALKLVGGYTTITRAMILSIESDKTTLKAENSDFGIEAITEIDSEATLDIDIKFDKNYFSKMIDNFPEDNIHIKYKEGCRSIIFESEGYLGLLMLIANV